MISTERAQNRVVEQAVAPLSWSFWPSHSGRLGVKALAPAWCLAESSGHAHQLRPLVVGQSFYVAVDPTSLAIALFCLNHRRFVPFAVFHDIAIPIRLYYGRFCTFAPTPKSLPAPFRSAKSGTNSKRKLIKPQYEPGLETAHHAGLEAAPANYPEVYRQQQFHDPKTSPAPSPYAVSSPYSAAAYHASTHPPAPQSKGRTVCGCSLLVFVLSLIIALLSAAVIGLAAGTGLQTKAVNDANSEIAALNSILATATGTAPGSNPTSTAAIDDGCDANPTAVTGSNYTAFSRRF